MCNAVQFATEHFKMHKFLWRMFRVTSGSFYAQKIAGQKVAYYNQSNDVAQTHDVNLWSHVLQHKVYNQSSKIA